MKKISSALISVYYKEGLEPILNLLQKLEVKIYSTGGTQTFIENLNIKVTPVEAVTGFPSILGGRVKTLHPGILGGVLYRRDNLQDIAEIEKFRIPAIDLIIVDLYPFEETVKNNGLEKEVIEKIDVGGVTLIRAAAKNYNDTVIVSNKNLYPLLIDHLTEQEGFTTLETRKYYAEKAFATTAHYDKAINDYFAGKKNYELRYGENPHQAATFTGNLETLFTKHQGKELSYNNLLDIDAALSLVLDFPKDEAVFAIVKHNNACGLAIRPKLKEAYLAALAGDPISAFGGILCCNMELDVATAKEIDKLFFEILIAPSYTPEAIKIIASKKNRIILETKDTTMPRKISRTVLNGTLTQERDLKTETFDNFKAVTEKRPNDYEKRDMVVANILVKHTKSNAIVLVKNNQLLASGTGQTSRVDALNQAIHKANHFGFDIKGAVMASDAFFPFPDCVEIAHNAGIDAVIQPGGSIKDYLSVDYCNANNMAMVITGNRHFKH
ncbi:MAG: bifunctional phosphoribosylaminoimidazolecarboxamide formyltransferase/IMP cyclohydrolase [Bacteroidia bacterium]